MQEQCDLHSGIDINEMEQELKEKNIVVHEKYKASDGLRHRLGCGNSTPLLNVYVISKEDLGSVTAIGFLKCSWLKTHGGNCYRTQDRNTQH